jgi:hypothetical protein
MMDWDRMLKQKRFYFGDGRNIHPLRIFLIFVYNTGQYVDTPRATHTQNRYKQIFICGIITSRAFSEADRCSADQECPGLQLLKAEPTNIPTKK